MFVRKTSENQNRWPSSSNQWCICVKMSAAPSRQRSTDDAVIAGQMLLVRQEAFISWKWYISSFFGVDFCAGVPRPPHTPTAWSLTSRKEWFNLTSCFSFLPASLSILCILQPQPTLVALILGAIMPGHEKLCFFSCSWRQLGPSQRFRNPHMNISLQAYYHFERTEPTAPVCPSVPLPIDATSLLPPLHLILLSFTWTKAIIFHSGAMSHEQEASLQEHLKERKENNCD